MCFLAPVLCPGTGREKVDISLFQPDVTQPGRAQGPVEGVSKRKVVLGLRKTWFYDHKWTSVDRQRGLQGKMVTFGFWLITY